MMRASAPSLHRESTDSLIIRKIEPFGPLGGLAPLAQ